MGDTHAGQPTGSRQWLMAHGYVRNKVGNDRHIPEAAAGIRPMAAAGGSAFLRPPKELNRIRSEAILRTKRFIDGAFKMND